MRNNIFLGLLLVLSACQTAKIKNDTYKVSATAVELGSIGEAKSLLNLQNDFKIRTLPKLENEIRLSIDIVPFNKKLARIYDSKSTFNQGQSKIDYVDSIPVKPELAIVKILDVTGFVGELNAVYNKDVSELLFNTRKLQIVSSILIVFSNEDLNKIRQADAYYLNNNQDRKYTISLYKQGKKTETLDTATGTIIGQKFNKFCWSEGLKGKLYIADMTDDYCSGATKPRPKKRKISKNLYKL